VVVFCALKGVNHMNFSFGSLTVMVISALISAFGVEMAQGGVRG
jgi:hypothetical protein